MEPLDFIRNSIFLLCTFGVVLCALVAVFAYNILKDRLREKVLISCVVYGIFVFLFFIARIFLINDVNKNEFAVKNISTNPSLNIYEPENSGFHLDFGQAVYFNLKSSIICDSDILFAFSTDKNLKKQESGQFLASAKTNENCYYIEISKPESFAKDLYKRDYFSYANDNGQLNTNRVALNMIKLATDSISSSVPTYIKVVKIENTTEVK